MWLGNTLRIHGFSGLDLLLTKEGQRSKSQGQLHIKESKYVSGLKDEENTVG